LNCAGVNRSELSEPCFLLCWARRKTALARFGSNAKALYQIPPGSLVRQRTAGASVQRSAIGVQEMPTLHPEQPGLSLSKGCARSFGQMWKTCQAFPARYQSVISDSTRLPPQYPQRYLAGFSAGFGILIIGGKEKILPNRSNEIKPNKAAQRGLFLFRR
jgi:hypothetical protein